MGPDAGGGKVLISNVVSDPSFGERPLWGGKRFRVIDHGVSYGASYFCSGGIGDADIQDSVRIVFGDLDGLFDRPLYVFSQKLPLTEKAYACSVSIQQVPMLNQL